MPHQFILVSISMPQCLFSMTCKYSTINIILTILISKNKVSIKSLNPCSQQQKATNLQINITLLSGNLSGMFINPALPIIN